MGSTSLREYVKWKNHIGHCLHQLHHFHPSPCIPHHAPLLFSSIPHHLHPHHAPSLLTTFILHHLPLTTSILTMHLYPLSLHSSPHQAPPSFTPPLLTSDTRDYPTHVTLWRLSFLCSCLCAGAQWEADGSITESFRTFQQAIQCIPT